jgi:hypothetical protein
MKDRMIRIVPYETFEVVTHLSSKDIVDRLRQNTEPKRWFRFSRIHQEFEGEIEDSSFSINRIIDYRNSFLPMLKGVIEGSSHGTIVKVRMLPNVFVLLFMTLWFGGIGTFACLALFSGPKAALPGLIGPAVMLLFGSVLMNWAFWPEAKISRKKLIDIVTSETNADTECLSCGKPLPIGSDKCVYCGWTYKEN